MKIINILLLILPLYFGNFAKAAESNYTEETKELLLKMQEQIESTLLVVSQNERNAGNDMSSFHYSIDIPAQKIIYLGLVLDTANSRDGYKVLSVTPGGVGDKLDIQPGDKVKAINNINMDSIDKTKVMDLLKDALKEDELSLAVESKGKFKVLTTKLTPNHIPEIKIEIGSLGAMEISSTKESTACGLVSIYNIPPEARDIYPVTVKMVDDLAMDGNLSRRTRHFLKPGKHTVYLREQISSSSWRVSKRKSSTKSLVIDVKANMSYEIGAQFIRSKRYEKASGEYWEPVVWRTKEKKCHL